MKTRPCLVTFTVVLLFFSTAIACAQDLQLHVTYVCDGQKIFIDSCNMRDLSDTASCMVAHPDKILANGLMAYTNQTRGALKKLLPTCRQPSAEEIAREKAFAKKVTGAQAAKEKAANDENDAIEARAQAVITGKKPQTADQKAMNRCITAGRVPAVCMGNALGKPLEAMIGQLLPGSLPPLEPGLYMSGNFVGNGSWRIEFDERNAAMKCADLAPGQRSYTVEVKNNQAVVKIDSTPKPVVLAMKADGTLVGAAGPIVVNGSVVVGHSGGGTYTPGTPGGMTTSTQTTTTSITPMEAQSQRYDGGTFNQNGGMVDHTTTTTTNTYNPGTAGIYSGPTVIYKAATRTCSQAVLSSKHAAASGTNMMQSMATSLFNDGDSGPPTPPGLRMHGTYGGQGGISVEFYPESAIIACGDAARAYPYTVQVNGSQAVIKIENPAHALALSFQPDGELSGGSGPYEVNGRRITGQNDNGDFTFAPLNMTCNLSALKAGATPAAPPAAANTPAAAATSAANPSGLKTAIPGAPTGNAILSIASGFPAQPGAPNPLAGHSYILLRDTLANALAKNGFPVPAGSTPFKVIGATCAVKTPDCQRMLAGINADSASLTRADANGKADMPGVPPGTYYLMISTRLNNQTLYWGFQVNLQAGPNLLTLDQRNGVPVN
ncbi:MAG TPA: hypothetical protein VGH37_03635 [Candidatus Acidoferrum sp.]|jgi:hypothetical protein